MSSTPLSPGDPTYPSALLALGASGRPPPTLYVRGRLPAATGVAIVGTRKPSEHAVAFTRSLAAALASDGIAIWSGGAIGIDGAAHEATLDAGGVTVLVAGGGLDRPYPPQHRPLFDRVLAQGGALVARVPDGTPPLAPWFLLRNEVLAALTAATVVIEAGLASGARSTAAAARKLGRALCVVPHPPWDERGRGCAYELACGAQAVYSASDVISAIGRAPAPRLIGERARRRARASPPPPVLADPTEAALFAALGDEPIHVDEACERAKLSASAATGALLTLTLRAVVVEGPAGFFRRVPPPRT